MSLFLNVISLAGTILVFCLAALGTAGLVGVLIHGEDRAAKARQREAERRIQDLGHQAQLQIMREALRRAGQRASRSDRGASIMDGWDVR